MACPALLGATKVGGAGAWGGSTTPVGDDDGVAEEAGGGWGSRLSKGVGGNPRIARASAKASFTEEEEVAMAQSCKAGAWGLGVGCADLVVAASEESEESTPLAGGRLAAFCGGKKEEEGE